jgi:ATP phosphoribosyltransferase
MLRVAVPNKGTLAEPATAMLREAGYRQRHDPRDLTVLDRPNDVEFFFLRPKDIAVYVGSGDLDLGITGRDLALDSQAPVREVLGLGFGYSSFRYAGPGDRDWAVADIAGRRVATAYPRLVADDLAAHGISAEVIRLDGAVEISVQLGLADVVADVVGSGRTLQQHGLVAFGEVICRSEAVLVGRATGSGSGRAGVAEVGALADLSGDDADRADGTLLPVVTLGADGAGTITGTDEPSSAARQLINRLRGVVFAQQYLMLDYDCPRHLLERATAITPGLESPTVAPLADPNWVAVRAMVPRAEANPVMDALADLGAKAVLASDIRSCRL